MNTILSKPEPPKMALARPLARGSEKGAEPLNPGLPPDRSWNSPSGLWPRKTTVIAAFSIVVYVQEPAELG